MLKLKFAPGAVLALLAFSPVKSLADELGLPYKLNEQRGAFKLTSVTVTTLLQSGYSIVGISDITAANLSVGAIVSWSDNVIATVIFLQRGANLYRCAEEAPLLTHVYCFKFSPVNTEVDQRRQEDTTINPLAGKWGGSYEFRPGMKASITLTVTDGDIDGRAIAIHMVRGGSYPNEDTKVDVLYYEQTSNQIIAHYTPPGDMVSNTYKFEFNYISDNRVAWLNTPYDGRTVLLFKHEEPTRQGPAGAIK